MSVFFNPGSVIIEINDPSTLQSSYKPRFTKQTASRSSSCRTAGASSSSSQAAPFFQSTAASNSNLVKSSSSSSHFSPPPPSPPQHQTNQQGEVDIHHLLPPTSKWEVFPKRAKLGEGAHGFVVRAHHKQDPFKSSVAIKIAKPSSLSTSSDLDRQLRREALLLAQLPAHKNVIGTIEVETIDYNSILAATQQQQQQQQYQRQQVKPEDVQVEREEEEEGEPSMSLAKSTSLGDATNNNNNNNRIILGFHHQQLQQRRKNRLTFLLVMEYCGAGNLHELIQSRGVFRPTKEEERLLAHIAFDVLSGLKFLHGLGIVHRDIKTSNIMLFDSKEEEDEDDDDDENEEKEGEKKKEQQEEGGEKEKKKEKKNLYVPERHIVKIADLGLSTQHRESKFVCGTLRYLAPASLDEGVFSAQSDLYAAACTFIALVTGKSPWKDVADVQNASNEYQLRAKILAKFAEGSQLEVAEKYLIAPVKELNFSENFLNFLRLLFAGECFASDALNHPWILEHVPAAASSSPASTFSSTSQKVEVGEEEEKESLLTPEQQRREERKRRAERERVLAMEDYRNQLESDAGNNAKNFVALARVMKLEENVTLTGFVGALSKFDLYREATARDPENELWYLLLAGELERNFPHHHHHHHHHHQHHAPSSSSTTSTSSATSASSTKKEATMLEWSASSVNNSSKKEDKQEEEEEPHKHETFDPHASILENYIRAIEASQGNDPYYYYRLAAALRSSETVSFGTSPKKFNRIALLLEAISLDETLVAVWRLLADELSKLPSRAVEVKRRKYVNSNDTETVLISELEARRQVIVLDPNGSSASSSSSSSASRGTNAVHFSDNKNLPSHLASKYRKQQQQLQLQLRQKSSSSSSSSSSVGGSFGSNSSSSATAATREGGEEDVIMVRGNSVTSNSSSFNGSYLGNSSSHHSLGGFGGMVMPSSSSSSAKASPTITVSQSQPQRQSTAEREELQKKTPSSPPLLRPQQQQAEDATASSNIIPHHQQLDLLSVNFAGLAGGGAGGGANHDLSSAESWEQLAESLLSSAPPPSSSSSSSSSGFSSSTLLSASSSSSSTVQIGSVLFNAYDCLARAIELSLEDDDAAAERWLHLGQALPYQKRSQEEKEQEDLDDVMMMCTVNVFGVPLTKFDSLIQAVLLDETYWSVLADELVFAQIPGILVSSNTFLSSQKDDDDDDDDKKVEGESELEEEEEEDTIFVTPSFCYAKVIEQSPKSASRWFWMSNTLRNVGASLTHIVYENRIYDEVACLARGLELSRDIKNPSTWFELALGLSRRFPLLPVPVSINVSSLSLSLSQEKKEEGKEEEEEQGEQQQQELLTSVECFMQAFAANAHTKTDGLNPLRLQLLAEECFARNSRKHEKALFASFSSSYSSTSSSFLSQQQGQTKKKKKKLPFFRFLNPRPTELLSTAISVACNFEVQFMTAFEKTLLLLLSWMTRDDVTITLRLPRGFLENYWKEVEGEEVEGQDGEKKNDEEKEVAVESSSPPVIEVVKLQAKQVKNIFDVLQMKKHFSRWKH